MTMRHASTTRKKRLVARLLLRRYSLSSAVKTVEVLGYKSSPSIAMITSGKQRSRVLMTSPRPGFGREIQITLLNYSWRNIGRRMWPFRNVLNMSHTSFPMIEPGLNTWFVPSSSLTPGLLQHFLTSVLMTEWMACAKKLTLPLPSFFPQILFKWNRNWLGTSVPLLR